MKRTLALVLSVLLIAALFVGCNAEKKILGKWEGSLDGQKVIFNFEEDGKGEIEFVLSEEEQAGLEALGMKPVADLEWKIDGKKLNLKFEMLGDSNDGEVEFKIKGDTLTLTNEDGDVEEFKKVK